MNPRETLRAEIAAHQPADVREQRSRRRILALLDWLADPFDEHRDPFHLTGSAIVVDGDDVLLHRHKRLGVWLQPGGHLDPGETPHDAAVRETQEETGVAAVHPPRGPALIHVDIHEGPRGHVHLDLRYLLHADRAADLAPGAGESPDVAWWRVERTAEVADVSLAAAIAAAGRATG